MNYNDLLKNSLQYILVTAPDWNSVDARMTLFERETLQSEWKVNTPSFDVVIGKKGIAWGKGLHTDPSDNNHPVKKEGDLRAPAGVFNLSFAFGYSAHPKIRWPYLPINQNMIAIDDPKSGYYNCVVDKSLVKNPDWDSTEIMLREDGLYKWGLVIEHNMYPAVPGGGSCIFMHIWRGPDMGTEGCTAMPEEKMKMVLDWLNPDADPILVQIVAQP